MNFFFLFSLLLLSLPAFAQKEGSVEASLIETCGQKDLMACEKLAVFYLNQSEWEKVIMIGEALCGKDMASGCMLTGSAYLAQGKLTEANSFLTKACDKFEPFACRSLARLMDKVGEKAVANMYFKRACAYGLIDICADLKNSKSYFSPSARSLLEKMSADCKDPQSNACSAHLGTIQSCALPLIRLDCQLLAGHLSMYFRAKLLQEQAKVALLAIYNSQKALKEAPKPNSYSYDLEIVLKDVKPQEKYLYVVGFMQACGKKLKTRSSQLFFDSYKHIGPRTTANILAYFAKGSADDCYDAKAGYEAYAVANLDPIDPSHLDVWKIDQDMKLENVVDGLPRP